MIQNNLFGLTRLVFLVAIKRTGYLNVLNFESAVLDNQGFGIEIVLEGGI
jgi:hypothetical protein